MANIDKRTAYGGGKFGEFCFDSESEIPNLLLKPPFPIIGGPGSWAGHRLLTVGQYAHSLPPNVFTEAEKAEMYRYHELVESDYRDAEGPYFYDFAGDLYCRGNIPDYEQVPKLPNLSPSVVWVLRNLTKRVFVRADVLAGDLNVVGPYFGPFGFEQLVLFNTMWSDDPSCNMHHDEELVPGPWCGDRFDITTSDVVESDARAWEDVSKEMRKKAEMVLEENY
ncbi:hypothetical protein AMATHDRAFT_48337 [Amanita thiersii Skay4041]|uniref:Uncharacterized protein n=1 Tax=Amanita thiersii Skay4041 TaxID=703135 RepID=A0A2A9NQF8_9AGAR|nr:hypothetical protein AMATHDRAFT_48337 [Amanita thiersii Skay4041]